jgi:hypothetical protein
MEPLSIIDRFAKEGPVILQAPVSFLTAVVIVGGLIWWYFHRHYAERFAVMKQQIGLYKVRSEQGSKAQKARAPQCVIQVVSHEFYWLGNEGEWHRFKADPDAPQGAKRGITLWVTIIAPSLLVESVKLVIMKEQFPLNWDSVKVFHMAEKHIHTLIPEYVSSGPHQANLVAFAHGVEYESESFTVEVPRI